MKTKLDPRPARDLTSRECSKVIGAMIGGLCAMAEIEDLKTAVKWWAENEEAWKALRVICEMGQP